MWFIGVEVEQETSASPPKKILDPPLKMHLHSTLKGCFFFVLKDFDQSQELKTIVKKFTILNVPHIGFLCYSN